MRTWRFWLPLVLLSILWSAACTRAASTGMPPTPTFVPIELATQSGPQVPQIMGTPVPAEEAASPTPFPIIMTPPAQVTPTPTPMPLPSPTPTPIVAVTSMVPTATPQPTSGAAELTVPSRYTLQKGEYPYCLARRFNIHPDDLLAANGLRRGQRVYPGMTLVIPQNARPWPSTASRSLRPHPTTYTTRGGETLYQIACMFGDVWPEQIAQANGIPLSDLGKPLPAGQTLRIP